MLTKYHIKYLFLRETKTDTAFYRKQNNNSLKKTFKKQQFCIQKLKVKIIIIIIIVITLIDIVKNYSIWCILYIYIYICKRKHT